MEDSLGRKLEHEREMGNLPGLQMVCGVKSLNHSQFADNTLFLGGASQIIATHFKVVLNSYLDASGGEVNHKKC